MKRSRRRKQKDFFPADLLNLWHHIELEISALRRMHKEFQLCRSELCRSHKMIRRKSSVRKFAQIDLLFPIGNVISQIGNSKFCRDRVLILENELSDRSHCDGNCLWLVHVLQKVSKSGRGSILDRFFPYLESSLRGSRGGNLRNRWEWEGREKRMREREGERIFFDFFLFTSERSLASWSAENPIVWTEEFPIASNEF